MKTANLLEAKSSLSRLVESVQSGKEPEVIIARGGVPAARLVPLRPLRCGPANRPWPRASLRCLSQSTGPTRPSPSSSGQATGNENPARYRRGAVGHHG
jgi:antitoxin (DNA-binding transcriptional repressor) of toxin-antitoxin stability system